MKHIATILASLALAATAATAAAAKTAATVISNCGYITWHLDKEYPVGQFVNGDWYVIGPVKVIAITNTMSDEKFRPEGENVHGGMINPVVDTKSHRFAYEWHGYDSRVTHYRPELNATLPNGKPFSKDNPIHLGTNQSLVSVVSWLWRTPEEREPGCPRVGGPNKNGESFSRPTIRAGAVLTCLAEAPPEGTFRPSYAGNEKRLLNVSQLRRDRLRNLDPTGQPIIGSPIDIDALTLERIKEKKGEGVPRVAGDEDEMSLYYAYRPEAKIPLLIRGTARAWIDHIPSWGAASHLHPAINISNYGRESNHLIQTAMLALNLDWTKIKGAPETKDDLIINMCQIGIDLAGCADAGSYWMAGMGHHAGRKPAILFAGLLLDDPHMKNVANWETKFQDDHEIKTVTQEHVDWSRSDQWRPDIRGYHLAPYNADMIGMPEWVAKNAGWNLAYRDINVAYITGFALTFMMMEDGRKLWGRDVYFDYADRANGAVHEATKHLRANRPWPFVRSMWDTFRKDYPSTYDKKWEDEKFVKWCTQPGFMLKAAPKKYETFELKDAEPIRMTVGHPVDLTGLTPKTVTVTSSEGDTLAVAAIEPAGNPSADFVIKFADGVQLKPRPVTYTVTLDKEVTSQWRSAIDTPLLTNKTNFIVR